MCALAGIRAAVAPRTMGLTAPRRALCALQWLHYPTPSLWSPREDGCITPSFPGTPIVGHMPHAHGIKRGIHHLTPPLRRRPCSEARWRSAIDPVGRHAINTLRNGSNTEWLHYPTHRWLHYPIVPWAVGFARRPPRNPGEGPSAFPPAVDRECRRLHYPAPKVEAEWLHYPTLSPTSTRVRAEWLHYPTPRP